jgi:hypothetical protein
LLELLPGDGLDEAEADDEGEGERESYGPEVEGEAGFGGHVRVLLWRCVCGDGIAAGLRVDFYRGCERGASDNNNT